MIVELPDRVIDFDLVEIRHGGEPVPVQPKVFALIEYLYRHRNRVVAKEELLDNIWGDRFVSESALTSRIKVARRVLGDDGRRQAVIKTVPGRGYRFAAPSSPITDGAGHGLGLGRSPDGPRSGEGGGEADGPRSGEGGGGGEGEARSGEAGMPRGEPAARGPDPAWRPEGPVDERPLIGRDGALDRLRRVTEPDGPAGVVVLALRGMGGSRLLAEAAGRARATGVTARWIRGLAVTRPVPLGALASHLPTEVSTTDHTEADLARGALFRQAYDHLASEIGRDEVLYVDDAHHLDELTISVIAALLDAGLVRSVAVARPGVLSPRDVADRVGAAALDTFTLEPLADADLGILLDRLLGGPIEAAGARRLIAAAEGRPGLLRERVETLRRAGALLVVDGEWRLIE